MALPLVSASAEDRVARYLGAAVLLLVAMTMMMIMATASAQDQDFSAKVRVDATADSAAAARDLARIDGQRRALAIVIERLSGSSDGSKLPKLDDKAITDMVDNFEVANERMSAVRYLSDYTFHFRPSKVRRLVRIPDSAAAESGSKPDAADSGKSVGVESASKAIILLPVYKDGARSVLWDDPNAWREAWAQRPAGSAPARLTVPLGDAGDIAVIDAGQAGTGKSEALTAIAHRNGGDEAIVATATAKRQGDTLAGLELSVKRYRSGRLIDSQGKTFDANPGEGEADFLKRAVDAIAADIERAPKKNSDQSANLAAVIPIGSLGDWVLVRDRLASVTTIRQVDLLSLNRQEAKVQIKYVGSPEQLKSSLAEVDLDLGGNDPLWRLQRSGVASSH